MCNDSHELKNAHSRSFSLVFSSLRSGSCCPALCLVSRSERTHELLLPVQDGRIFGMDALVTACFRNTNVIMVLAWMLW